ncbi:MAG: hypothetical protein EOP34_01670 [Rickettsiales bacterium]|nr:MAG: hypothetical protein EOP34_01670 [Rickettsiales bacterium]
MSKEKIYREQKKKFEIAKKDSNDKEFRNQFTKSFEKDFTKFLSLEHGQEKRRIRDRVFLMLRLEASFYAFDYAKKYKLPEEVEFELFNNCIARANIESTLSSSRLTYKSNIENVIDSFNKIKELKDSNAKTALEEDKNGTTQDRLNRIKELDEEIKSADETKQSSGLSTEDEKKYQELVKKKQSLEREHKVRVAAKDNRMTVREFDDLYTKTYGLKKGNPESEKKQKSVENHAISGINQDIEKPSFDEVLNAKDNKNNLITQFANNINNSDKALQITNKDDKIIFTDNSPPHEEVVRAIKYKSKDNRQMIKLKLTKEDFTGFITVNRVDEKGNLLDDSFDVIKYENGKATSMVSSDKGRSRVDIVIEAQEIGKTLSCSGVEVHPSISSQKRNSGRVNTDELSSTVSPTLTSHISKGSSNRMNDEQYRDSQKADEKEDTVSISADSSLRSRISQSLERLGNEKEETKETPNHQKDNTYLYGDDFGTSMIGPPSQTPIVQRHNLDRSEGKAERE